MSMKHLDTGKLTSATDADSELVTSVEEEAKAAARKLKELEEREEIALKAFRIKRKALREQAADTEEVLGQYREVLSDSDDEDDTPAEPEPTPEPQAAIEVLHQQNRFVLLEGGNSTGTGLTYHWEFGDAEYVDGEERVGHTYRDSEETEFTVRLRVTDVRGRHSIATHNVTVEAVQAPEPEPRPEPEPDPAPAPLPAPRPRTPYNGRPHTLNELLGAIVFGIVMLVIALYTREFPPHIHGVGLTVFAAAWCFVLTALGFYAGGAAVHHFDHEEDEE